MKRDDLFQQRLTQFEALVIHASRDCARPVAGAEAEDLYQEALLVLDQCVKEYSYLPDADWERVFKTALWHKMVSCVRTAEASKRDWRRVATPSHYRVGSSGGEAGPEDLLDCLTNVPSTFPLAEDELIAREDEERFDSFVTELLARISEAEQILLFELLYPRDLSADVKILYARLPKRQSTYLLARLLGWPREQVRKVLLRLRVNATHLAAEMSFEMDYCPFVRA